MTTEDDMLQYLDDLVLYFKSKKYEPNLSVLIMQNMLLAMCLAGNVSRKTFIEILARMLKNFDINSEIE